MAQTWFAWSDGPYGAESLQDLLRDFNDQQMVPREVVVQELTPVRVLEGFFDECHGFRFELRGYSCHGCRLRDGSCGAATH